MNIRHCLFWYENGLITAILYKNNKLEIMRFGGMVRISFTEDYWEKWVEHSGFCSDDKTDFCIIYDNEPVIVEKLRDAQCAPADSIWNKGKIQKAVEMLNITAPTGLYTENGAFLFKVGSFRQATDHITLIAKFINAENEVQKVEKESAETTPFIQYYEEKLRKYKESTKK